MDYMLAQLLPYIVLVFAIGFVVGWASIEN